MYKRITVLSLISLVTISASGCRSHSEAESQRPTAVPEMTRTKQVSADQVPADVIKTIDRHVLRPRIIEAETIMFKHAMAYKVYVRSGNTVYIVKVRPDGYFLSSMVDED